MRLNPISSNISFKDSYKLYKENREKMPPPGGILIIIKPKNSPKNCCQKLNYEA